MCGITGYFKISDKILQSNCLKTAADTISHRGPDDSGYYENECIGLGHRRLSIIDLTMAGHQPMCSNSGRYIIAYNGEIYNFIQLKTELLTKGFSFQGHSDTEVIVNGFEYWGNGIFEKLNGIFAISIWDNQEKKLVIARDRMGVKPLYYWCDENFFLFGSEIKTILSYPFVERKLNIQAFHEFLYYGYGLGENTLFLGIQKVMPGQLIEINKKGVAKAYFWTHENIKELSIKDICEEQAIQDTKLLLEKSVKHQLVSDVPVGVFLSGGIDSSAITAFASKYYEGKIKSYSAGFDFDGGHNELPLASKIAKKFGTEHNELMIFGKDMAEIIKKMILSHDEPFSDAANIPLYLLSKEVKNDCKVILQGDGGDELFAGYPRYHIMANFYQYKMLFQVLQKVKNIIPSSYIQNKTDRFFPIFNNTSPDLLFAKFLTEEREGSPEKVLTQAWKEKLSFTNPFERYKKVAKEFTTLSDNTQKLLWIDTKIILPDQFLEKVDKSTMANGVEVRVPFLDNDLVSYALSIPSGLKVKKGVKKYLLKKALKGTLPNEVLYGPKKGFGVPYQNWLKGPLKKFMMETFNNPQIKDLNLFDYQELQDRINQHCSGKKDWGFFLWKLLNFCIWAEEYKIKLN